ncbi:MAG: SMC-Scp complex subunit ScpB [Clostridia bacterium]|nr:SMC-Scp complex subunit ScpB [Clostridia bacterium]
MNAKELNAAVEAMLFASGEPLEIVRIAEVLGCDVEQVENIVLNLADKLDESGSGLCVMKLGDKAQMCSRQEFAPLIRDILDLKRNTPLSGAAFEVLAVIAYNQPVTKSFVEQVRGVDCSGVISTLCQRGLIEEKGRLELPGRPLIYGTTSDFLRCFCVSDLSELPPLPEKNEDELKQALSSGESSGNSNGTETIVISADDENLVSEADDDVFNEDFN